MNTNTMLLQAYNERKFGLLKRMLEENLLEEQRPKAKGRKRKPETIINSMFKSKHLKFDDNMKNKAMPLSDKRFAFTDGMRIFISNTNMGFEEGDMRLNAILDNQFDSTLVIDTEKIFEKITENKANKNDKEPIVFEVEDYKIGLNPKFVKDLIDFTGITTLKYTKQLSNTKSLKTPLFAVNEKNKIMGCVLPVMIQ